MKTFPLLFGLIILAGCAHDPYENPVPEPTASFTFSPPNRLGKGDTITFSSEVTNAYEYFWEFGDESVSVAHHPVKVYEEEGFFWVRLTVTGKGGSYIAEREVFIDPFKQKLKLVPGGTFMMGCTPGDPDCDTTELPVHQVRLDSFYLGITEVTQQEWELVMGDNPSIFKHGPDYPVENISLQDVNRFLQKLNGDGKGKGYIYCLPTEAQWEYAARAGEPGNIYSGSNDLDSVGWYIENDTGFTAGGLGTL